MNVTLRPGTPADAERCGEICYNAFQAVAEQHNFPPDFPSQEVARGLLARLLANPGFFSVVAEVDGTIVGSNFLDERSTIAGLGPITVDPAVQNRAVGRQLMQNALDRVKQQAFPGVRLLQAAYHNRSLSLYARLGFVAREPLSTMQGLHLAYTFQVTARGPPLSLIWARVTRSVRKCTAMIARANYAMRSKRQPQLSSNTRDVSSDIRARSHSSATLWRKQTKG
jgi:predicted N-acetyltransferase YhbS